MYPYYKGESATKVLGKGHDDVMMDDKLVPLLLGSELGVNTQKWGIMSKKKVTSVYVLAIKDSGHKNKIETNTITLQTSILQKSRG